MILTDWYSPPKVPNERFKINIYILDRALRADGVRVSVFRQVKNSSNGWQDAVVQPGTATKIVKGLPNTGLDEAALKAIKRSRWYPARQRDKKVGIWLTIPVDFSLTN